LVDIVAVLSESKNPTDYLKCSSYPLSLKTNGFILEDGVDFDCAIGGGVENDFGIVG
jgi:hypothetical protein